MKRLLIVLSLLVLTLGQFERIGQGIYLHDIILGLFILVNIKNIRLALTDKTKKYGWYFIGFALLSLLLNVGGKPLDATMVAVGYWARWTAYYLVFCLMWNVKEPKLRWFNIGLLIYSVTVLFIGLTQWLLFPDMRMLSSLGWDDHYFRLIGSWLDPNFTGLILVLGGLPVLGGYGRLGKYGKLGLMGLFLLGILLTYSRSSYIALIVGVIFLFKRKAGLLVSLCVGALVLGYAFFIPKPAGEGGNLLRRVSVETRLRSYKRGWEIFKTSPIYGVGFNYYKYAQEKAGYISTSTVVNINSASGNDNSFILILATTGLIGFTLFIVFWIKLFISSNHVVRASMAAITVHSLFNNSLFFPAVIIWLWMVIAISINSGNSINRVIKKTNYEKR